MQLADFIAANKDKLIEQWRRYARERLALDLDDSELLDDLPAFLDDLVEGLRSGTGEWPQVESAKRHGRQRVRVGAGIGSLTEEMNLVGATVAEIARQQGRKFTANEVLGMMLLIGEGAAVSVSTYAKLRDQQLADQAAQHFAFIAHEIRNPLHNARLAAQLLAKTPEADRGSHLERLNRALDELSRRVDDSLVEARLYGDPRVKCERLRSVELVAQAHEELREQVSERNLVLEHDIEDFALDGDRALLGSALINLLRNAVKFTCDGGRILVSARHTNGDAIFEIHDQCGGIPEDLLPRLFQPFVRERPVKGGSGLGLLIAKQAAEAHGGRVEIENHPGTGCSFRLSLPRQAP